MESIVDHVGIKVKDMARAKAFYQAALAPLEIKLVMDYGMAAGFGRGPKPDFWIGQTEQVSTTVHVCFSARSQAEVDAFHAAALAAGGKDNGGPGLRAMYHPTYYGAFVFDPDGHNIEAVFHGR